MRSRRCLTLVVLLSLFCLTFVATSFADGTGDNGTTNPGDPAEDAPLCKARDTLQPTSGQFSDVWMILMAMAFQLAL